MKKPVIEYRKCNICGERMTGGVAGFISHGEERHPNYFLSGADVGSNIKFSEKVYWCPVDQRWHNNMKWLSRSFRKYGWTNEQYYIKYGKEHLPDIRKRNTSDPVLGDARNHDTCIACGKSVKFCDRKWEYPAFCCFSCSTTWFAENTDRVRRAQVTLNERKELDPTLMLTPCQTDYWTVKKGLTIEEARLKVKERQQTNTLEKFIKRAGGDEMEGKRRWLQRQERWLKTLEAGGWFGNHSKVSQKLFSEIETRLGTSLHYGEAEQTVRLSTRFCKLDCILPGTKKAIEFFGDYWHANPAKYTETDVIRRIDRGAHVTARELWARDKTRLELLKQHGYEVLVIWEADYAKAPEHIVETCLGFLNS